MSKHTPGPWEENDDDGVIYGADGVPVCEVTAPGPTKDDLRTARANSSLIVATPDLLAALESVDAWWEQEATVAECLAVREQVRAAIAKARGGK